LSSGSNTVGNAFAGSVTGKGIRSKKINATLSSLEATINALQVRNMMAVQKWKEISQCGDKTYRDQIARHFGIQINSASNMNCLYLGGSKSQVVINEEVNSTFTSETDSNPIIKGKGIGSGNGSFTFDNTHGEHGILMIVYHAEPQVDYNLTGITRQLATTSISDMFIPEFDRLGLESVTLGEFFNVKDAIKRGVLASSFTNSTRIGYAPRYYEYKTELDKVRGVFRSTRPDWVAQYDVDYLGSLDYSTIDLTPVFKCNPQLLDDIFGVSANWDYQKERKDTENKAVHAVCDNDQLYISCDITMFPVRPMDYNGMPY